MPIPARLRRNAPRPPPPNWNASLWSCSTPSAPAAISNRLPLARKSAALPRLPTKKFAASSAASAFPPPTPISSLASSARSSGNPALATTLRVENSSKPVPIRTDTRLRHLSLFPDSDFLGFSAPAALGPKMKLPAKSWIQYLLLMVATSAALFAQTGGPEKPQNQANVLDARQILVQSLAPTERSWQARDHYTFTERDEDRRLDALGHVKSENVDATRMTLVNGIRFERLMEHNGQLPSAEQQKKRDSDFARITPSEYQCEAFTALRAGPLQP